MRGALKVATFTVHADARQSARWKQAAEGEGFPSVGAWLAGAADAYLKAEPGQAYRSLLHGGWGVSRLSWKAAKWSRSTATSRRRSARSAARLTAPPATTGGSVTRWSTSPPGASWQRSEPTASPGHWLPSWPGCGSVAMVRSRPALLALSTPPSLGGRSNNWAAPVPTFYLSGTYSA